MSTYGDPVRRRPDGASDGLVEAVGTASEAVEYVERARGHLYSFHQLIGRADLLLGRAAELLDAAGEHTDARMLREEVVGRNVLDGRWTFQVVEEFDHLYHSVAVSALRRLEERHMGGRRHVHESELKEARRTHGAPGHEHRPPDAHDPGIEVDHVDPAGGAQP